MTKHEIDAATFMIEQADRLIDEGNARIRAAHALMDEAKKIYEPKPANTPIAPTPDNLAPERKEAP